MPDTGKSDSTSRLVIHQPGSSNDQNGFAEDVRAGLTATPKTLKPKYLYDALGSLLFEAICHLPEYYLTRAETEIFERRASRSSRNCRRRSRWLSWKVEARSKRGC